MRSKLLRITDYVYSYFGSLGACAITQVHFFLRYEVNFKGAERNVEVKILGK